MAGTGRGAAAAALLLALLAGTACVRAAVNDGKEVDGEELKLEYSPDKNREGQPVGTPTKATLAGRELYYEVPQVR